ncbi:hypothetical protein GCM10027082_06910 [Comamonas humi]
MNAMHTSSSALSAAGSRLQGPAASQPQAPQLLDSQELLRGNKAVTIQHNGSIYRLQATKLGKLILTK